VLHADDRVRFREVVAVLDALYATRREVVFDRGIRRRVPVFNMTFAAR
jgi:hypothetical protein